VTPRQGFLAKALRRKGESVLSQVTGTRLVPLHLCAIPLLSLMLALSLSSMPGCGLFEPRDPEQPSQSSLNFQPPTEPSIVISNLQSAVEEKNAANYISCFSDESKGQLAFVFSPSPDAAGLYGAALANWTLNDEQAYFQNLIARSSSGAFATLSLSSKGATVSADSVVYSYDYTLVFEHNVSGFATTARGTLQFTLRVSQSNFWAIQRWVDFKTTTDLSWSHFKGKFSN
jgi:hypothetical protein